MDTPRTIGKYEVLERIGTSGIGGVYTGRDPVTKGLVTIEVCTSEDDTLRRRFLREAEIAGSLHHRNIVTVFELGQDSAAAFRVQEHLGGENLAARIQRREPVREDIRMGYLLQIARALEYAHRKGILHRDLRPSNVRVLENDRVKILGFGTAKLSGAETQLARDGRVPGAAGYLSPEQIRGEPVDARSDVFTFGVLAYELLTYVHPFPGTTASELLGRVVEGEPEPIRSLWPGCPPEIGAAVMRCLERDPDRRYASLAEVAEALASVLAGQRRAEGAAAGPPAAEVPPPGEDDGEATREVEPVVLLPRPSGPSRRRLPEGAGRLAVAAGVILAIALLALAAVWLGVRRGSGRVAGPAAVAETGAAAPPGPGAAEGLLVMDAVPWGEVVRVTDGAGGSIALPDESSTPLVLPVPPGLYTVEISSPVSLESRTCRAEVAAAGSARCATEFYRLEALEYFQEAGWWR